MTKIKICGLFRSCDIDYVNEAKPDFCGFIIDVPKSHRNVTVEQVRLLRKSLCPEIQAVGVFVDAPQELIAGLVLDGTLDLVQLHGQEDEVYIAELRKQISVPIIKAFSVQTSEDVRRAEESSADCILLDHGSGGTGASFDWSLLTGLTRPYVLAGGLTPKNLPGAIKRLHPWTVDLSSGVETDGEKDRSKILAAVQVVRNMDLEDLP